MNRAGGSPRGPARVTIRQRKPTAGRTIVSLAVTVALLVVSTVQCAAADAGLTLSGKSQAAMVLPVTHSSRGNLAAPAVPPFRPFPAPSAHIGAIFLIVLGSFGIVLLVTAAEHYAGKKIRHSVQPKEALAVAFSADGERLAAAVKGSPIYVWDAGTGASLAQIDNPGWTVAPWSLALSPHGDLLAAGVTPPLKAALKPHLRIDTVRVWRVKTHKMVWRFSTVPALSKTGPTSLAFSRNEREIAGGLFCKSAGAEKARLYVWDAHSGKPLHQWKGGVAGGVGAQFSPQGNLAAQRARAFRRGQPSLWNVSTGKAIQTYKGCGPAALFAFSPDGANLAGGQTEQACVWDAGSGKKLISLAAQGPLVAVGFSSSRSVELAAAGFGVSAWDLSNQVMTHTCPLASLIGPAQFSPDGKLLAWGDPKLPVVHLWDVEACKEIRSFTMKGKAQAGAPAQTK